MNTSLKSVGRLAVMAASVLGFLASGSAVMADQITPEGWAKHVTCSDLNLSTPEGQAAAHERLHQVARDLCSRVADPLDLSHQANYLACVDGAMAKATQRLQALVNRSTPVKLADKPRN